MAAPTLDRTITRWPAILLVVSAIVGSGVFKKIAPMSDSLQSSGWILICWLTAGVLSLIGALCTAELAAMMPGSGGEYVYFKKIYGKFFAFLYGWGNLTVMKSASIAALAYIFSESAYSLFNLPVLDLPVLGFLGLNAGAKIIASLLIFFLSFINHRGVVFGERLSRFLIAGIIIAILGFCVAAFVSSEGSRSHFTTGANAPTGWPMIAAFFAASVSAFWGYEGWNNIGYLGEEVKEPQKNIPLALTVGTFSVIILYMMVNAAYIYILPVADLAALNTMANKIAAVEVARVISGSGGAILLSALIVLATFTCTNSTILMSSRMVYAIGRDKLFFKKAGEVHPKYHSPSHALWWQCGWSIILVWSGSFDQLTDLLIFASFIFYGATALGVIVMRYKFPKADRPYKVIAYPLLPVIFTLFCMTLVVVTVIQNPVQALVGLILIFSGVPVYLYFSSRNTTDPLIE
ncbi:APC family permease [Daejeonella lutea]|uniref:Basic amino acid/polyamine antiporter, APA family n=1 Tax=Daejeonella lutea TaxID=572036 RepID=A0A1T5F7X4_9SPHI|nr:amino acid permease [Daejeonella lutea]SKB92272.1 basic amino acid/polyamine antiporter, APA family [Daejeonella lutea]